MARASASLINDLPGVLAVAGSYEGGLYGWDCSCAAQAPWSLGTPEVAWSFQAHLGAVKAVAVDEAGELLATGGVDEFIKLFSLKTRKEKGELTQHKGSVTCLQFFKSSHLLSASQDGTVVIWRASDWLCVHVLGGHKDAVTSLSMHPSGRMALSGSKDRTVRLWNLVEGRCAFITKPALSKLVEIDSLDWSPDGKAYALAAGGTMQVYDATKTGKQLPVAILTQRQRINDLKFISSEILVTGGDDCALSVVSVKTGEVLRKIENTAKARIKSIAVYGPGNSLVSTVTSNGDLHFWDIAGGASRLVQSAMVPGATSRLTSLALTQGLGASAVASKHRFAAAEAPQGGSDDDEEVIGGGRDGAGGEDEPTHPPPASKASGKAANAKRAKK